MLSIRSVKGIDYIESSHKSDIFSLQKVIFFFMRAQDILSYHLIYVPCIRHYVGDKASLRPSLYRIFKFHGLTRFANKECASMKINKKP